MKRIGMLRISQETNAFSPFVTEIADFRHYRRGADLLKGTSRWGQEVPGALRNAELSGFHAAVDKHGKGEFEIVPLFSAWAIPSGPLSTKAIEHFCDDLRTSIAAAGKLDGLFFCLHGAMMGEGGVRPEAVWLKLLRELLGDIPISVSADLHALVTKDVLEQVDIWCSYRTNPHRDLKDTGYRAGKLLLRTMRGEIDPVISWRTLPMIQGGGMTLDFLSPVRKIFRKLTQLEKSGKVLDASFQMVHLWLQHPELGWSVLTVTDGPGDDAVVEELAQMAWEVRKQLPFGLIEPDEALAEIRKSGLRRKFGTICLCDASDTVGAGAPGTNTALIRLFLEQRDLLTYAPLRDATAVESLWNEPIGAKISMSVGGREEGSSPALDIEGRVLAKFEDQITMRSVTVDCGHVKLVIAEGPPMARSPSFYRKRGLHPSRADVCIVKNFFPFRLFFMLHNRKTIYVVTEGATDIDRGIYQEFTHPTWPKEDPSDWRDADRARRAL